MIAEINVSEPGIIRGLAIGGEPKRVAGPDGRIQLQEKVILFAEYDPDVRTTRRRAFLTLGHGQVFELHERTRASFIGVGVSVNTGAVVYVYELVQDGPVEAGNADTALTS